MEQSNAVLEAEIAKMIVDQTAKVIGVQAEFAWWFVLLETLKGLRPHC